MQAIAIFSLLLLAPMAPVDAPKEFPFLAGLTIPKERLPEGCKVADVPADEIGVAGFKNQAVSTDARLFVIADERLGDLLDLKLVQATYFGMYRERKEVGIVGWAFQSEDAAKKAYARLTESYKKEPDRMRFWRAGRHVVWLWRDPGTSDACFAKLEKFVDERVEALTN
jgi:hypothetical protein